MLSCGLELVAKLFPRQKLSPPPWTVQSWFFRLNSRTQPPVIPTSRLPDLGKIKRVGEEELTGDENVRGAVLAVVDEEVGLGALRQCVLARVRVRRPLRHRPPPSPPPPPPPGSRSEAFKSGPYGEGGIDIQAEPIELTAARTAGGEGSEPSPLRTKGARGKQRRQARALPNRLGRSGVDFPGFGADHVWPVSNDQISIIRLITSYIFHINLSWDMNIGTIFYKLN